jgi:hypothetical protein
MRVKWAMTVSNLVVGFGLTESGIKMLEDTESNEQRIAQLRQGYKRIIDY